MDEYLRRLRESFRRLNRDDQIQLIANFSTIVAILPFVCLLAACWPTPFYRTLCIQLRALLLPAIIIAAWLFARDILIPFLVNRLQRQLN